MLENCVDFYLLNRPMISNRNIRYVFVQEMVFEKVYGCHSLNDFKSNTFMNSMVQQKAMRTFVSEIVA